MAKIIIFFLLIITSFATTAVYHTTQQENIFFYQAESYFRKGEYEEAIPLYEKALRINPFRKKAVQGLAYSYQWTNRNKKAIELFEKITTVEPADYKSKIALADTLSWDARYDEAIPLYLEVIAATGDTKVKEKLARVYSWAGEYAKAQALLDELIKTKGRTQELLFLSAEVRLYAQDYAAAEEIFRRILEKDPANLESRIYIADIYAYSRNFKKAIEMYDDILKSEYNRRVKEKLADVLSWDRQYKNALKLYDELLREKEDWRIRRQKARILGWMRDYDRSLQEYETALKIRYVPELDLEMKAKKAYWDNRINGAISDYSLLLKKEPHNLEAMFDLSQIYSYQSMWDKAVQEYNNILRIAPAHFRAREGLGKAKLIAYRPGLNSGYEFYEADSPQRDSDIKRQSFFNRLHYPLNDNFSFEGDYRLTFRSFADFGNTTENQERLRLIYLDNPCWWGSIFYDLILYNRDVRSMQGFGADAAARIFDAGQYRFSYERKRLENNSTVIRGHFYGDDFIQRLDIDVNKRFKLGADYLYSLISDRNFKNEPGFDLLYYFSFEPKRFTVKYRYYYRNYNKKVSQYFSPKGFNVNSLAINWRHYLNKEEVFFGADDFYYEAGYEVTVDSQNIVGHKFSGALNWDIDKRLNLNIKATVVNSSANVYRDRNIIASLKYYF